MREMKVKYKSCIGEITDTAFYNAIFYFRESAYPVHEEHTE